MYMYMYIWEEYGACLVFASYTLAFALQLREKHGKTSVREIVNANVFVDQMLRCQPLLTGLRI